MKIITVLLLTLVATVAQSQDCDEFFVTAIAGDSITNVYWGEFRDATSSPEWEVHKVALGGLKAQQFNGMIIDYTQDLIDIGPASVVLLLGTNDSLVDWTNPDHSAHFAVYTDSMGSILDRLDAAGIAVILGIPTPMRSLLSDTSAWADAGEARLEILYRPWLKSEAEARNLLIVDFNDVFVSQEGWEDLFPEDDGVHPRTEEGKFLMAEAAADAICLQYVPEPGQGLSILFGTIFLAGLGKVSSLDP